MVARRRVAPKKSPASGPTFPRPDYISDTPYNQLPKAERQVWKGRVKADMDKNPFLTPFVLPGMAIKGMHAAVSDALGGRKNLVYKKTGVKVKRETGK
jgi:hypothetical protein